jgi:hypothetical protein
MFQVQPTWVNETLDDEDNSEQEKAAHASEGNPVEGAFNPLAESGEVEENPLNDDNGASNPLEEEATAANVDGESETQMQVEEQQQPMNEEDALLATATEQPPFVNECQEEEGEAVIDGGDMLDGDSDNPLGGIDGQDSEQTVAQSNDRDPFSSEQQDEEQQHGEKHDQHDQAALSEEDLLTGPAHNLDDTQYKADYVDPNLDDIFK